MEFEIKAMILSTLCGKKKKRKKQEMSRQTVLVAAMS